MKIKLTKTRGFADDKCTRAFLFVANFVFIFAKQCYLLSFRNPDSKILHWTFATLDCLSTLVPKMLSRNSLPIISFCFSVANYSCAFPLHWDSKVYKFFPASKHARRISILLSIKLWIFFLFVVSQTKNLIVDGTTPGKLVFVQLLEIARLLLGCSIQTSIIRNSEKVISLLNKALRFNISYLHET